MVIIFSSIVRVIMGSLYYILTNTLILIYIYRLYSFLVIIFRDKDKHNADHTRV